MRGFGELEAVVMDCLWDRGEETTVREVFEELHRRREIAYTTVMSTMDNLHRKDWLARRRQGKAYLYWPRLTREEYGARLMRDALNGGGRSDVVLTPFPRAAERRRARRPAQAGRARGRAVSAARGRTVLTARATGRADRQLGTWARPTMCACFGKNFNGA